MQLRTLVRRPPRVRWRGELLLPLERSHGGAWYGYGFALDAVPAMVTGVEDDLRMSRDRIQVASGRCVDLGPGVVAPEAAVARRRLATAHPGAPCLVPVRPLERWLAVITRRGRTALVRPMAVEALAVVVWVQVWE
ncbi:hypothetical protein [Streptomyces olivaceiscleroticus]|uniref:Uncharacterized protein n=1 Tax=Streptomyces olivaceiscleroticus TaxID=68245 RepID=A0ABN0ZAH5_9ACTN